MTASALGVASSARQASQLLPIIFVAALGVAVMSVAGLSQAQGLHNAAHDARHATGFPCH